MCVSAAVRVIMWIRARERVVYLRACACIGTCLRTTRWASTRVQPCAPVHASVSVCGCASVYVGMGMLMQMRVDLCVCVCVCPSVERRGGCVNFDKGAECGKWVWSTS